MPRRNSSNLYAAAQKRLKPADRSALNAFEKWLVATRTPSSGDPVNGRQLAENLRNEAHLNDDQPFGDPRALRKFLAASAKGYQKAKPPERVDRHRATCQTHCAKGLRIDPGNLPRRFYRYSTSKTAAAALVESVLGLTAKHDFDRGLLSPREAFARIAVRWSKSRPRLSQNLAGGVVVWATFDHGSNAPRDDATGMAQALALPLPPRSRDTILMEFSYESANVGNHRFPTVADAGLVHLFRPSAEAPPDPSDLDTLCGWTNPTGAWPRQPEIVHDNAPLSIVGEPPRFVGRIL